MIKHVPFDVFEVKLAGSDMPGTIQALEQRGTIIEAAKFSKFLTGAAAFNAGKVSTLPYWANCKQFNPLFAVRGQENPPPCKPRVIDSSLSSGNTDETSSVSKAEMTSKSFAGEQVEISSQRTVAGWQLLAGLCGKGKNVEPQVAPQRPARVEPKSYFANER